MHRKNSLHHPYQPAGASLRRPSRSSSGQGVPHGESPFVNPLGLSGEALAYLRDGKVLVASHYTKTAKLACSEDFRMNFPHAGRARTRGSANPTLGDLIACFRAKRRLAAIRCFQNDNRFLAYGTS